MPEPIKAGAGTPTDNKTASTPQSDKAADKPTTPTSDPLMRALGIPEDVQARIMAGDKAREKAPAPEVRPDVTPQGDRVEPQPEPTPNAEQEDEETAHGAVATDSKEEPGDDDDDDDDATPEPPQPQQNDQPPQKVDKRQKRINRLTRQKSILEDENAQLREQLEKAAKGDTSKQPATIPSATGRLAYITDERQLNREIAKSEAVIDWCNERLEGKGFTKDQIDPKFSDAVANGEMTLQEAAAKSVAGWKEQAQQTIISAPNRRDEIRTFNHDLAFYDDIARKAWPDLFDKKSQDYQLANAIMDEFPHIKASPQRNYAVGLVIEGMKSLKGKVGAGNGNGNGTARRAVAIGDISPRAFEPRVPIAPSAPEPPTREARTVASTKKVTDAMSALVRDPDGSAQSLAALLAAEEEAGVSSGATGGRAAVKV